MVGHVGLEEVKAGEHQLHGHCEQVERYTVPFWRQTRLDGFPDVLGLVDDKNLGRHSRGLDLMALEMSICGMEGQAGRGSEA